MDQFPEPPCAGLGVTVTRQRTSVRTRLPAAQRGLGVGAVGLV